ncbi:MAG TPA: o-succinylbenzoate synthase [Egibacteraceae bacterium]|nr:o-succinylbenzoate synthase [Egibacteraceae bacterium]
MRAFRIPLRIPFRGLDRREGVLVHGPAGWGEFSPFPDYGPRLAARWLRAVREATRDTWPAPLRDRIPVNVTVPAVSPQQAHTIVAASGCATAKVKVAVPGRPDAEDVARVEAVRDALGPAGRLRVDANGAWDVDAATRMLRALGRFDLEYAEQPVATLPDMARLRRRVDVPLAADESVRSAEDPLRGAGLAAADVVVLKVHPLGGVREALRVAEAAGLPAVVSSALETSVGIAAGLALAAALPDLPHACGLATVGLLAGDVVADPLVPVGGAIALRRPPVSAEAAARWQLRGASADAWRARLAETERSCAHGSAW